jgi:hypothetical protein
MACIAALASNHFTDQANDRMALRGTKQYGKTGYCKPVIAA